MKDEEIQKIADEIVKQLTEKKLAKKTSDDFCNTEKILYNYRKLKRNIKNKTEQIEDLKEYGLKKSSLVKYTKDLITRKSEEEVIDEYISNLTKSIVKTEITIDVINRVLEKFKNDKYIDIIKRKYGLDGNKPQTIEEISEDLELATTTTYRQKVRIINEMKVYFFPNEQIEKLVINEGEEKE